MATQQEQKQKMEKTVSAFCERARLFAPLPPVVYCAVSGGADSMALLHLLLALLRPQGVQVRAVHVNHGLRGEAAGRDEAFVRQACQGLGVALSVFRASPPPGHPGEDWARRQRYGFFAQLLQQEPLAAVATAHTLSDQAETLLFRLARGTGLHGAAGIPARRGSFVRPLLCLTRAQTEQYCALCGCGFVTDETNLTPAYARNRLRQQAVPALCSVNEAAVQNMGAFCRRMAALDAYLAQKAQQLLCQAGSPQEGWRLEVLRAADAPVLQAALHSLVSPVRDAEEKYVRLLLALVARGSGAVQLTAQVRFVARQGRLWQQSGPPQPLRLCEAAYPLQSGTFRFAAGREIRLKDYEEAVKIHLLLKNDLKNCADYDKIPCETVLRTRRPGDWFAPAGRGVRKTLKKLFNEEKLAQQERERLPLLAAGSRVLWLWDHGFAEGLQPTQATVRLLHIAQAQEEYAEHGGGKKHGNAKGY